jgi:hypothetical protein
LAMVRDARRSLRFAGLLTMRPELVRAHRIFPKA